MHEENMKIIERSIKVYKLKVLYHWLQIVIDMNVKLI